MPSDSNGVYSLPNGYLAKTGDTIQPSQHNPPLEDLGASMSQRLMRTGAAPMTGPFKVVDGSAGAPAFQFASDSTTGFYKTPSGFAVSISGVKVADFTSGGVSRLLGELIPWTLLAAPALTVFPYGQTLSRTTYADFWEIAQDEISGGNTFYNNGNGTTTFGVGDMRGRGIAGNDAMGGTPASRLTSTYFGTDAGVLGAAGGSQNRTLIIANLPPYTPAGTIANGAITFPNSVVTSGASGANLGMTTGPSTTNAPLTAVLVPIQASSTFLGAPQGGSSTSFSDVQPTLICNFILFVGA